MMAKFPVIALCCLGCLLSACREKQRQANATPTPEVLFYVRADYQDNKFLAEATLPIKDPQPSEPPFLVSLNGRSMPIEPIATKSHRFALKTDLNQLPGSFEFQIRLKESQPPTVFSVPAPALPTFNMGKQPIAKSQGFEFAWEGKPLQAAESLSLLLTDNLGQTHTINIVGPLAQTRYFIRPQSLDNMAVGGGVADIVFKGEQKHNAQSGEERKAKLRFELYAKQLPFVLVN